MNKAATARVHYPTRYERAILTKADAWLRGILAPAEPGGEARTGAAPLAAADPRLILLCMTPRSGSSALSATLASTGRLGLGGERLNHKNKVLNQIAAETEPRTKRELLERVIEASRTPNGVAQIKCDLPQLLPFLLDPDCHPILSQAKYVYLTRGDILRQAISRHRSLSTGIAHAHGKEAEARGKAVKDATAPYAFGAILDQIDRLTRMMAAYEKIFALLDIQPLRVSYEQISAQSGQVVRDIARLVDIGIKPATISGLGAGGYKKVSGSNNDALREAFLAEAPSHVFAPEHRQRKSHGRSDRKE